jgi:hypothetical protein
MHRIDYCFQPILLLLLKSTLPASHGEYQSLPYPNHILSRKMFTPGYFLFKVSGDTSDSNPEKREEYTIAREKANTQT